MSDQSWKFICVSFVTEKEMLEDGMPISGRKRPTPPKLPAEERAKRKKVLLPMYRKWCSPEGEYDDETPAYLCPRILPADEIKLRLSDALHEIEKNAVARLQFQLSRSLSAKHKFQVANVHNQVWEALKAHLTLHIPKQITSSNHTLRSNGGRLPFTVEKISYDQQDILFPPLETPAWFLKKSDTTPVYQYRVLQFSLTYIPHNGNVMMEMFYDVHKWVEYKQEWVRAD